jgi:toxin ParE1/3/4
VSSRLVVRLSAEADIADAALWYEARARGLGADFLRAVDVALAEVERMPERFPVVHRQCRRALLRRFPFAVYYVLDNETISVVACMHAHRDPQAWGRRVSEGAGVGSQVG